MARGSDFPVLLRLRYSFFEAFARVAEREVRPVEDVLNEFLADLGNHVHQRELVEVYGDEEVPTPPVTQAMRLARHASEQAERYEGADDEHEELARRYAGGGYVEMVLAVEG